MRFIFNFIFFGILFYIIYLFFPDAFATLVSWVAKVYEFLRDIFMQVYEKLVGWKKGDTSTPTQALLFPLISFFRNK